MDTNFTGKERAIARILSRFPSLKKFIKRIYQVVNYNRFKEDNSYVSDFEVDGLDIGEAFFGYYDKSPLCADGKLLLCHSAGCKTVNKPNPSFPISINLINFSTKKIIWKYHSTSYNWQQGSRLQWINTSEFIFNVFKEEDNSYASLIYNVATDGLREINYPIYDCFQNSFSLSLNYRRLNALSPDYGYRNMKVLSESELKDIKNDGIFYVDLIENSTQLYISLEQIIAIEYKEEMSHSLHSVNHIMISPNGEYAMFIHRYYNKRQERKDRLLLLNICSKKISILVAHDMVSHCAWVDDNNIIGYLRDSAGIDAYYMLNISRNSLEEVNKEMFRDLGDGHPSVKDDKMIYDTYPNKARMKSLNIYNLRTKTNICLGKFLEPLKYDGETRCDLHPRFSPDGKIVFFDSVHTGLRNLHWVKS